MEKDETKRQRFVAALTDKQTHYRLYKSRHGWLVMGITTIALAAGLALTPQVVKADEQAVADAGVTASVDSNGTDNTSSDPVSDPVTPDETPATDSNATDSTPASGDAAPDTDPAPVVDNSTTDSASASGTETTTPDPAPTPSVSDPVTSPTPASDSEVINPPASEPAPASADTTGSQTSTSDTSIDSSSPNVASDTSASTLSDGSDGQSTASSGVTQDPTTPDPTVQPADVAQPAPLALADVAAPKVVIPAPTTPDSATITEQIRTDGLTLNVVNSPEDGVSPDGRYRIAAAWVTTQPPGEPLYSDARNAWNANPMWLSNYNISISNMRLIDGHWETTAASVVTFTIPPQVVVNNTGMPLNTSANVISTMLLTFMGVSSQASPNFQRNELAVQAIPGTNNIQVLGQTLSVNIADMNPNSSWINIRNQTLLMADPSTVMFQPWVSLGIITKPTSLQLAPTIDSHAQISYVLSGTGTEVGNTITILSQDSETKYVTTVDANGKWAIDRNAAGFNLDERLYVIESNNLGDKPGAVSDQQWAYNVETIYYIDVDHNPLGQATQQVLWTNISTIAFDASGKLIFTTHWTPVDEPIFPAYTLPDLPEYPDLYPRPRVLPAERSQGPGADINQIVPYLYKWLEIKPGDTIPEDYKNVTIGDLTTEVHRTVSFVTNTGDTLQPSVEETLTFTRTAVLNVETKQLDHYTDWVPTTSDTFAQMDRPVFDGYFTPTAKVDAYTVDDSKFGVSDQDQTAQFVYFPRDIDVTATDPKDSGTPIDDQYPDGPKFSTGTTTSDLNWTKNWTVQYVAYNDLNTPLASATHQSESFKRNATVHFDLDGKVSSIDYSDWTLSGNPYTTVSNFPTIRGYVTTQTSIDPPTVTPPADASNSGQTQTDYIKYYPANVVVQPPAQPDGPLTVTPGGPTVPGDDQSPKYPADLQTSDFVKTITRTINFVLSDGQPSPMPPEVQTVSFKRTISYNYAASLTNPSISYGDWEPYDTSEFAEFTNPTIPGYLTLTPTVAALPTTVDGTNTALDVQYYPDTVKVSGSDPKPVGEVIDPAYPDGPKYPAGVDTDDLTLNVPVVIHYVEGVDLNNPLAEPTTQQVTFTRDATIKFAQDGTPTVTYDAYQPDSQTSAGLATIPEVPGWVATVTDLPGIEVKPDSGKLDQYVKYYRAVVVVQPPAEPDGEITVTPGGNTEADSDSPKYPAVIDKSEFVNNLTRTIEYVDSATGDPVSSTVTQILSFKRTVGFNYTDDVLNPVVFYGSWEPYTTSEFEAVASPTVAGYFTLTKQVDALTTQAESQLAPVMVLYYPDTVKVPSTDPKAPGDLIDEKFPEGPQYPTGVDQNDLNDTVNVTIHFVDARDQSIELQPSVTQTVNFARDATVHFDQDGKATVTYTDWTPDTATNDGLATLPTIDGYVTTQTKLDGLSVKAEDADGNQYVLCYPVKVTVEAPVTPNGELSVKPGDPTVPGDDQAPKYPADLKADDLISAVQRIIHYTDEAGVPVIKDAVQTVYFKRSVIYDYTDPENPVPTFGAWEPYTDGSFEAVPSPVLADWFTATTVVPIAQATAEAAPIVETVIYNQRFVTVQPDGPYIGETSKELLNEAVTQTIHYLKPDGSYAAQDHVTTLEFTRTATVNAETGEVISLGSWTPTTTDTFEALVSPTFPDLFTDTKEIVATTVKAEDGDIEETVQYDPLFVTVPPDGPFIGETSKELLNTETTLTIHYVDKDGNQVADDHTAVLAFTRTAKVNVETEKVESYSAWQPVTTDSFAAVDSPVLPDLFTVDKTVGPIKVTDPEKPIEETVVYNDSYLVVEPDGPYVGGTSHELQNETVTQTIHYVKADGSEAAPDHVATLAFTRTAVINVETDTVDHFGEWQAVTTDTFDAVISPEVTDQFTKEKQIDAAQVTAETIDLVETVHYNDLYVVVQPEGPDYPGDTSKEDLNESVTQTIHYVDENGATVSPDVSKTLDFTRTATINAETSAIVAHSDWTPVTTDTFEAVTSPSIGDLYTSQKTIDAVTVKADAVDINEDVVYHPLIVTVGPDGPYVGNTSKELLNQEVTRTIRYVDEAGKTVADDSVKSLAFTRTVKVNAETGEIVDEGTWIPTTIDTFDAVKSPDVANMFTTQKTVDAKQVTALQDDITETVTYKDLFVTVKPDGPYVGEATKEALNQQVNRTIHYVDAQGNTVAPDHTDTLLFTRTVIVDAETGAITDQGTWTPTTTDTFGEVVSPTLPNLYTTDKKFDAVQVKAEDADLEKTITYNDLYITIQPEGPDYPGNSAADQLNHTVTQTIHYVKADGTEAAPDSVKTLTFTRTAKFNVETQKVESYSDWVAVDGDTFAEVKSPDVKDQFTTAKSIPETKVTAETVDINETVQYNDLYQVVQPEGPDYPGNTTQDLLNKTITSTIHYLKADGNVAAEDSVQALAFKRTATINVETGEIVGYGDWQAVDGDTFKDIESPVLTDEFTTDKIVKGQQVTADSKDPETTVQYQPKFVVVQPEGPDYPGDSSQDLLNKTITQTIHYVDVDGKSVAEAHMATLDFTRTAKVDLETGAVVEWGAWQPKTTDTFVEVFSPDVADLTPDKKQIVATKVTGESKDITETVTYSSLYVTVEPDGPFIGDTSEDKLNHTVTQTIHYVLADGSVAAPDSIKSLPFKRTAQVNVETGEILSYGDWEAVTTDTFDTVISPTLTDLFTTTKQIDATKVDGDTEDIVETVKYQDLYVIVKPGDGYPNDPTLGDTIEHNLIVDTIRTVKYVDESGKEVAQEYSTRLTFQRTAKVNVETNAVEEYTPWDPLDDTFPEVTSPVVANMFTTQKTLPAIPIKPGDADIPETVIYQDLYVTVKPEGPTYPTGVTKDDLNQSVTQTIHYVKADGSEAAPDHVVTLAFTRSAKYNLETGKVEEYSPWVAVDGDTFAEVISPDVPDQFTAKKQIDAVKVTAETPDVEETVAYSDLIVTVEPDGPYIGNTSKELLNQSVTRTIHYVDAKGNQVLPDGVQTLDFTRTATVNDETGEVISKSDWKPATTDTFEAVDNPDVNDMYTTDDSIEAVQVAAEDDDLEATITYKDLYLIVKPEGPDYPDGISKGDLNQEVTQTIRYVDDEGKPVAPDHQITLKFTRTAKVNVLTGEVIYSDWQVVTTDTFAAVPNPILKGYETDAKEVGSQTVTADSADLLTIVIYKAITTPTPKPEPQPKPQPEPEPQPAPDQGAQPGNETPAPNTNIQQIGPAVITPVSAGTTSDQMPTTSDAQNTKLSLIGLILASFATVGAWFTTRKHKKGARH